MKSFNGSMKSGYNKFRKSIDNSHAFRKAHNTLSQINNFALPALTLASLAQPELAPIFGGIGVGLNATQKLTSNFK